MFLGRGVEDEFVGLFVGQTETLGKDLEKSVWRLCHLLRKMEDTSSKQWRFPSGMTKGLSPRLSGVSHYDGKASLSRS